MLAIYHWEPDANSGKPIMTAYDKGVEFESRHVDLLGFEQHEPGYLKVNPNGTIPSMGRSRPGQNIHGGADMDYAKYIEAFNAGDDAALVQKFFTEDCVFQSGPRFLRGREELLKFLNWAHDGIREIIRAQLVLRDDSHIFAEIDMDFHATRDRPDFTFGALKKGEHTTVKFLVVYYLRDGKVAHLKAGSWPANVGVTKATPRLGG